MKAIYKGERCLVVEQFDKEVELEAYSHDHRYKVKWGDPDLTIDPTDDQWENAV